MQKATPKDGRCVSGFEGRADVQQIGIIAVVMITVLLGSANNRRSVQTKTAPEGAAIDYLLYSYDFFLLAIPTKPISPEPNNQTAAGMGTAGAKLTSS